MHRRIGVLLLVSLALGCPDRPNDPSFLSIEANPTVIEAAVGDQFGVVVDVAVDQYTTLVATIDGPIELVSSMPAFSPPSVEKEQTSHVMSVSEGATKVDARFRCLNGDGGAGTIDFWLGRYVPSGGGEEGLPALRGFVEDRRTVSVTCTPPTGASECGNDLIEGFETCDTTQLGGATCETLGLGTGSLSCTAACQLDTSGCSEGAMCGNGAVEPAAGEQCEPGDADLCDLLGLGNGPLTCSDDCTWNTSGCSDAGACGNEVAEAATMEDCDGGDLGRRPNCTDHGFDLGAVSCAQNCSYDLSDCRNTVCGDGVIEGTEQCDGDEFGSATCEDFGFTGSPAELICTGDCMIDASNCQTCGNDKADDGEECDGPDLRNQTCMSLGLSGSGLSCGPLCTYMGCGAPICGDQMLAGNEICDGAPPAGRDCVTEGFDGGQLACNSTCDGVDPSGCFECGDDAVNGMEVCDGTALNNQTCASLGLGFTGGTLGCLGDCSGYDTSGCTTGPAVTGTNTGLDLFGAQCFVSVDGVTGCSAIDGAVFHQYLYVMDALGQIDSVLVMADSASTSCAYGVGTAAGCFHRGPTNAEFTPLDNLVPGLKTVSGLFGGVHRLRALDPADGLGDYLAYNRSNGTEQLHVLTYDQAGNINQTWGPVANMPGLLDAYWFLVGTTLYATVVTRDSGFSPPTSHDILVMVIDTLTNTFTTQTAQVAEWPDNASRPQVGTVMLDNGDVRTYLVPPSGDSINVADFALGTLAASTLGTIAVTGGTIVDMATARSPGGSDWLIAEVEIAGVRSVRYFELPATPPATSDMTTWTQLHTEASVSAIAAGLDVLIAMLYDPTTNTAWMYRIEP